jgi:hypothetical protein
MSLPAAVLPAPIAVLVLAWGEATPAVRALVEATQASAPPLDSLLVLVPQADAPAGLSAEEYLPLPPPPAEPPAPAAAPLSTETQAMPGLPKLLAPALPLPGAASTNSSFATPAPTATAATTTAEEPAPLAWAAVRVVRLGSLSLAQLTTQAGQPLPAPIWTGTATTPAAPYLGAAAELRPISTLQEESQVVASPGLPSSGAAPTLEADDVPAALASPAQAPALIPSRVAQPTTSTQAAPLYDPADSISQAPDLEADLLPAEAEELASFEAPQAETLTTPDFLFSAEASPAQADWSGALAALRQPAALPDTVAAPTVEPAPKAEPAAEPERTPHPALRPAAPHYPAPDLNFQIIQYARFAVPVALAEPPFAVIYAPAWPTWLAAQELRQRTGRPLVLHVATLAAAAEPVGTATGWIAELQRQALQRADLILTETPALAARLRHELRLPAEAVQAVAAADAAAIAQALHTARPRPAASQR